MESIVPKSPSVAPLGIVGTALLSGTAALLLYLATYQVIPLLAPRLGLEPVLLWFLCGGVGVFVPLVLIGLAMLYFDGALADRQRLPERLWLRRLGAFDWLWSLCGLLSVGLLGAITLTVLKICFGEFSLHPSFLSMEPLTADRYWILAVWVPFWLLNILGEEFLWRGVVLPRQEVAFGRWAWLANGLAWLVFHIAFGTIILVTVLPILFILPYLVQRQQNAWIGVVIHGGLNGPGFIAVALGYV